ncbi:hypothetical protein [Amycolatopsis sp. NPDC050768]|uniref:hypothetical protein n=1 Tax=Amycolatopsis sp. NPDC050768 TaxID=3154839 RepID=UPI0033D0A8FF
MDEAAMRGWGEKQTIRAWVVRDIVRGRLAPDADPHGLRLRGARIAGRLDLDNITSTVALALTDCLLGEGCSATGSHLADLNLTGCRLDHPNLAPLSADRAVITRLVLDQATVRADSLQGCVNLRWAQIRDVSCTGATLRNDAGSALDADGLQTDGAMFLGDGFRATGAGPNGAVRLVGAHIGGQLSCRSATLHNDSGPALDADRLQTDGAMFLVKGFSATGARRAGAVRLHGAHIGGQLSCRSATLHNDSGPALSADGLQTDGAMFLDDGFRATGVAEAGAVRLVSAHIGGQLSCRSATLRNDSGPALSADGLRTDFNVLLCDGFSATGAGQYGAVRLADAHIGSQLSWRNATLHNDSGPALDADGLQTDGAMFLDDGFRATGAGQYGAVRLVDARIGSQLSCGSATLHNDSGPALNGDGLQTDGAMILDDGFRATGAGEDGTVRLRGARIGGQLLCRSATLRNDSGPALIGDGLQTDSDVFLDDGFCATGAGEDGTVRLRGARIGGQLLCRSATLHNDSGPALNIGRVETDGAVFLVKGFSATGAGAGVVLDLTDLRVGGALFFDPTAFEHNCRADGRLAVDGLVYSGVPQTVSTDWLSLLGEATPAYSAQPYQQLAAAHRAAGHDREARRVLIQQRRDQIERGALTGRGERAWVRFTGRVLGYGYQPWRALLGLLATVILAVMFNAVLGGYGGLAQIPNPPNSTPRACTIVERIGVGLDLGTPLISTGARAHCDATNSATGESLTGLSWFLRLSAWGFATLFIAGFTGAVRKT